MLIWRDLFNHFIIDRKGEIPDITSNLPNTIQWQQSKKVPQETQESTGCPFHLNVKATIYWRLFIW